MRARRSWRRSGESAGGWPSPLATANQPGNSKTETNSRPEAGEPLTLPGYELLADPDYQRELRLSAAQVKRLIEISAKFTTGIQKSGRDLQRAWDSTGRKTAVPQDLVRQLQQATQDLENAATREVEAVLSAEQLAPTKLLPASDMPTSGFGGTTRTFAGRWALQAAGR